MSTRSLTAILDNNGNELVTIYNQYDGYPSGYGVDLAEFLSEFTIINGVSCNTMIRKIANGMECLAGQIVSHFKVCVGGIYLYPPNTRRMGDNYLYIVSVISSNIMMKLLKYKDDLYEEVFYGSPEEFIIRFK
jgi:hypothetical protein